MIQCTICKEFFNPCCLSAVIEHLHKDIQLDKEYYGEELKSERTKNNI